MQIMRTDLLPNLPRRISSRSSEHHDDGESHEDQTTQLQNLIAHFLTASDSLSEIFKLARRYEEKCSVTVRFVEGALRSYKEYERSARGDGGSLEKARDELMCFVERLEDDQVFLKDLVDKMEDCWNKNVDTHVEVTAMLALATSDVSCKSRVSRAFSMCLHPMKHRALGQEIGIMRLMETELKKGMRHFTKMMFDLMETQLCIRDLVK